MNVLDTICAGIERVGWSRTAQLTGLARSTLYRCFKWKTHAPGLSTINLVLPVVGLDLSMETRA